MATGTAGTPWHRSQTQRHTHAGGSGVCTGKGNEVAVAARLIGRRRRQLRRQAEVVERGGGSGVTSVVTVAATVAQDRRRRLCRRQCQCSFSTIVAVVAAAAVAGGQRMGATGSQWERRVGPGRGRVESQSRRDKRKRSPDPTALPHTRKHSAPSATRRTSTHASSTYMHLSHGARPPARLPAHPCSTHAWLAAQGARSAVGRTVGRGWDPPPPWWTRVWLDPTPAGALQ